jgi:hypothetical protein
MNFYFMSLDKLDWLSSSFLNSTVLEILPRPSGPALAVPKANSLGVTPPVPVEGSQLPGAFAVQMPQQAFGA